jgi:transposase
MEIIPEAILDAIITMLPRKKTKVGRPEMCPRRAINAIWYVMKTGCQWSMLPNELGCSSTVHGKFIQWCRSGVIEKIMDFTRKVYEENNLENNWYAIDSSFKKAPFADFGGKNPTDANGVGYLTTPIIVGGVTGTTGQLDSLVMQLDGKIVAAGEMLNSLHFCVITLMGLLIEHLEVQLLVYTLVSVPAANSIVYAVALQADGKLVGVGKSEANLALLRYINPFTLAAFTESYGNVGLL